MEAFGRVVKGAPQVRSLLADDGKAWNHPCFRSPIVCTALSLICLSNDQIMQPHITNDMIYSCIASDRIITCLIDRWF